MPRATLTYDLPDDNAEFRAALAGREALIVLHEIDSFCRNKAKYGELAEAVERLVQEIREMIPGELLDI